MSLAIDHQGSGSVAKWPTIAWTAWLGLLLFLGVRTFLQPHARSVYPIWSSSSRLWWSGGELYKPYRPVSVQSGFRYSPTFPILATPFALFPDAIGGVLWRWGCALFYAGAVVWWLRSVVPKPLSSDQTALLFLFLLPLSIQSMSNGQANVPVIAFLLASLAAVKDRRWNWASLFIALAFACKLYPLALGLLLLFLYPRKLGWRVPGALLAVLVLPFLTQHPDYVLDQYHKWFRALRADDRSEIVWDQMYRDLWLLIRAVNAPISRSTYEILQVLTGGAVAVVCWVRQRRGWPEKQSLNSTLALGAVWMLLLGPATESCTFILLAPSLAWSFLEIVVQPGWTWRRGLLLASGGLFLLAAGMGTLPAAVRLHAMGVHPLATLIYGIYLLTEPRPRSYTLPLMVCHDCG